MSTCAPHASSRTRHIQHLGSLMVLAPFLLGAPFVGLDLEVCWSVFSFCGASRSCLHRCSRDGQADQQSGQDAQTTRQLDHVTTRRSKAATGEAAKQRGSKAAAERARGERGRERAREGERDAETDTKKRQDPGWETHADTPRDSQTTRETDGQAKKETDQGDQQTTRRQAKLTSNHAVNPTTPCNQPRMQPGDQQTTHDQP